MYCMCDVRIHYWLISYIWHKDKLCGLISFTLLSDNTFIYMYHHNTFGFHWIPFLLRWGPWVWGLCYFADNAVFCINFKGLPSFILFAIVALCKNVLLERRTISWYHMMWNIASFVMISFNFLHGMSRQKYEHHHVAMRLF